MVPFRRETLIGWVTGGASPDANELKPGSIRPVLAVLDDGLPAVSPEIFDICRWMAEYYAASEGFCFRAALPTVLSDSSRELLVVTGERAVDAKPREARILAAVFARARPVSAKVIARELRMGSIWPEIRSLTERGALRMETFPPRDPLPRTVRAVALVRFISTLEERDATFGRALRQRELYERLESGGGEARLAAVTGAWGFSRGVVTGLEKKGLVQVRDLEEVRDPFADLPKPPPKLTPTRDQAAATEALVGALRESRPRPFLLHGVTGSGKTLVYIDLLRETLARGKGALVLVPQIALTPQTVRRFRAHFPDDVAVLHSGLSDGERFDAWRQLRRGKRRIAIGARSAIFAPIRNLGAIIVDEEHDSSYKQNETPAYLARDLAVVRAHRSGAVCVLGSATPSLESWQNARAGKYVKLDLPRRVGGGRLPKVKVVDLRETRSVLSPRLTAAVNNRLDREEQSILLLNRRGYSSFVQCRECGEVDVCPNCSISLTFHRRNRVVTCHHCGHSVAAPDRCGLCGGDALSYRGLGTEQVERIVAEQFPGARIARMDLDTTSGKWAHRDILDRVEAGAVDILLGTQMIAKGLDFPRVTLVGVINADIGMHLPDFRATERTYQLISQVAGRAGRGPLGGAVIVQTRLPDHFAITAAVDHDYAAFAERELGHRALPAYPPFVRLMKAVLSSPDRERACECAESATGWVRDWVREQGLSDTVEVLGPAPAPIERLHGRWRWHLLARSSSPRALGVLCTALARDYSLPAGDLRLGIDRDPVALM